MKICRLIYRSIARADWLTPENLEALLHQSTDKNEQLGIRGLLVVSGGRFLQVLEGSQRFVNQIYNRIIKDDRHHQIELISFEYISHQYFHDWGMRAISLDHIQGEARQLLLNKYPNRDGQIQFPHEPLLIHALLIDARQVCAENATGDIVVTESGVPS